MENDFIPYEKALALKELGFNQPCYGFYGIESKKHYIGYPKDGVDKYLMPSPKFEQCFYWFGNKYDIYGKINMYLLNIKFSYKYEVNTDFERKISNWFNTYEEAELQCLNKLIEIAKLNK